MIAALILDASLSTSAIHPGLYSKTVFLVTGAYALVFFVVVTVRVLLKPTPDQSLYKSTWEAFKAHLDRNRLLRLAIVLALLPPFIDTFSGVKKLITFIHPFSWDETFMVWDRTLHFGFHPYEILQPLFTPILTSGLNVVYHLWFFVMFSVVLWQAFSREREVRMQFLISYVLTWALVGNVLAIVFSSAGPCFYGRVVGGDDPFIPLMTYLKVAHESYPVWVLEVQQILWEAYEAGAVHVQVSGISAMPSMHVGSAVLFALVGWKANKWLGIALTVFAVLIMVGSVHLGYHYAIDGYFAAAVVAGIWFATGALLRRVWRTSSS